MSVPIQRAPSRSSYSAVTGVSSNSGASFTRSKRPWRSRRTPPRPPTQTAPCASSITGSYELLLANPFGRGQLRNRPSHQHSSSPRARIQRRPFRPTAIRPIGPNGNVAMSWEPPSGCLRSSLPSAEAVQTDSSAPRAIAICSPRGVTLSDAGATGNGPMLSSSIPPGLPARTRSLDGRIAHRPGGTRRAGFLAAITWTGVPSGGCRASAGILTTEPVAVIPQSAPCGSTAIRRILRSMTSEAGHGERTAVDPLNRRSPSACAIQRIPSGVCVMSVIVSSGNPRAQSQRSRTY